MIKENPYKIGNILVSSWGYDQTNIDFFQVTRLTAKSIYIKEIKSKIISYNANGSYGKVVPLVDNFISNESRHKVLDDKGYIKINSFALARPWSGNEEHFSDNR
jgi:hypothetical protein